jgi:AraC-like DNA-binding protein
LSRGTLYLTLTLAGWGCFQAPGEEPRKLVPGTVSVSPVSSPHRIFLPAESPGWTFAWIAIDHTYLKARIAAQVNATGPLISIEPRGPLAASLLRLVRGAIKKDFRDRFDSELAQIDFTLAFERWAQERGEDRPEVHRLANEVRTLVVSRLPQAIGVDSLAAEFRMSRSHFSCYFRKRTGFTPSHFATEVRLQEAMRRLRSTTAPLKSIAFDCGFASTNHFCKVFRRFVHASPTAFRQLAQPTETSP